MIPASFMKKLPFCETLQYWLFLGRMGMTRLFDGTCHYYAKECFFKLTASLTSAFLCIIVL